jgi:hypothetical protein
MNDDNDEDISSVMRQRQSREEVRRRNREIMERANAELREGNSTAAQSGPAPSGKKELSRFSLIKQSREGSQTFWVPYQFHSQTPELIFGPLKCDLEVDVSKFAEFNRDSYRALFTDCLKNTCLVDPSAITFLDLVNPEEGFSATAGGLETEDEPLLTNELVTNSVPGSNLETAYTGHFLRKPQLMSNDIFTEGNRNVGSVVNRFNIPRNSRVDGDGEFDAVKALDGQEVIFNAITKTNMKPKRILPIVPDDKTSNLIQLKFDDRTVSTSLFGSVLDKSMNLFEDSAMVIEGVEQLAFPRSYAKRRRYVQLNKATGTSARDEYYLLSIHDGDNKCHLKSVGSKILLKKDATNSSDSVKLILNPEEGSNVS